MTIQDLVNIGIQKLAKSKSTPARTTKVVQSGGSPALDAEVFLSHVLDKPKEYLLTNPNQQISPKLEKQFNILLNRRLSGWPVAYLTSHKEFFGLKFYVDKNILIPRPETEGLVEYILEYIFKYIPQKNLKILDIGTGSGAIIISLEKNLNNSVFASEAKQSLKNKIASSLRSSQRQFLFFASDISKSALEVAKLNAKTHKVKINFKPGSLLEPWKNQLFDVIVANLPYLAKQTDPSTKFEPKRALVAAKKGLKLYEELFKQICTLHPVPCALFLEIGHDQGEAIKKMATKWLPTYETKISKDLAGRTRYAVLIRKSS